MTGKKIAVCVASLFIAMHSFGEGNSFESVCFGLAKNKITKGNFIQKKTVGKNGRMLKSNGKFIMCPLGIVWATEKPFKSVLVLAEDRMIQFSSDGERKVTDAKGNDSFKNISSAMLAVFSNDLSEMQRSFNIDFNSEGEEKWTLVLEPKDAAVASFMTKIILSGKNETENSEIISIVLDDAKGNGVCYEFSSHEHPGDLTEDEKDFFADR